MTRIICVGSMNMDIAAYGETLPRPGETVMGHSIATFPGGKGLNQAVAARRLGAEVAMIGVLGDDDTGGKLAAFLDAEGIDTAGVRRVSGASSGTAIILVDARSENSIVVIPGANMSWPDDGLDNFAPLAGDLVVSQFEVPVRVIDEAFRKARAAGAVTLLNAAPARAMPADLLALVDVLIVNETELAVAAGGSFDETDLVAIERTAITLSARGPKLVVTLGSRGALVVEDGGVSTVAAVKVAAIDTAGAGDCFIGALAAAMVLGETVAVAAAFANRAAAVSVTRKGTAIAMPLAHEV